MNQVSTVGLDLAKYIFQLHGADSAGAVVFRKKLRRGQLLAFLAALPPCTVAMEACGSAHYWGREIAKLGHTVKLIAPAYVKPFVKRQKNDMADAEAICEAAQRPTMRFVALKSANQQAAAVVFRTRDLLVRQRTQAINALRGHLTEFGVIAAKGPVHTSKDPRRNNRFNFAVRPKSYHGLISLLPWEATASVADLETAAVNSPRILSLAYGR